MIALAPRYSRKTKREAVDFALRRAAVATVTTEGLLGLEGIGWDGDLDGMRSNNPTTW